MELSKTVPAVLVVLSLFVFPGCSSDSFNAMHPRGLITAHSLRNARQKQDFTLPAPVSSYSQVSRNNMDNNESNTPNETQTEDESEEMTIETLVKQSQKDDDDWEPKDRRGQQIYEELTGRSMNSDQSFMDSLKRTGPVDQLMSSANNNAFQASTFYSKNGGLTDSSKQSAAGAANSIGGVSSTNSLNSLTGTNNLQNLYSNSLSPGNSDLTSNTWSSNNNGGSALQTLPDKQTTSSQTSLPQLTQQEQQAYFKQLAALEAANAVAYTQSSSTPVTSQQQLLNKYALEQTNRRQQINNQPNLQHHNSGQPMPIQGPTGLFGTVIHPFRQMGQSLMQTIEPLISPDTQHQFAIPLPRSQIENKIDFFGKQLSSVSGGGGYAPAGNPTSYGGGPVVGPSPTYGAPSVTQYSASTDTYGGNFDTLSVINSDSLPFFAGAALSAAIAAFCISAIASTTNVAIGKRSTDENAGIAKMITNYIAENYHPLLEQGFEEISLYTNEQCVRELSCRAMEMMIGHENLISIEERIETAFEQLNHNGDLRHQVNDLMKSAEKQKCHQYKCWQKVWNSDLMSGFNPFMDTKYD